MTIAMLLENTVMSAERASASAAVPETVALSP